MTDATAFACQWKESTPADILTCHSRGTSGETHFFNDGPVPIKCPTWARPELVRLNSCNLHSFQLQIYTNAQNYTMSFLFWFVWDFFFHRPKYINTHLWRHLVTTNLVVWFFCLKGGNKEKERKSASLIVFPPFLSLCLPWQMRIRC